MLENKKILGLSTGSILAILVLLGVIVGAFFLLQGKKSNEMNKAEAPPAPTLSAPNTANDGNAPPNMANKKGPPWMRGRMQMSPQQPTGQP